MKKNQPTDISRKPGSFAIEPEKTIVDSNGGRMDRARSPQSFPDGSVVLVPDDEDPFLRDAIDSEPLPLPPARKSRFSFLKLAFGAFGILISLALGLWLDGLVRDLFNRADWLGYLALGMIAIGVIALALAVGRELAGLYRLQAVQSLKNDSVDAWMTKQPAKARAIVSRLDALLASRPESNRGRKVLEESRDDIIDGPQLIELAERELLSALDTNARRLILSSAKRVSVVTAVSPRAVFDLAYVLFEIVRLVRSMAELYGGRPGKIGMLRLLRDVVTHLAVTGTVALGDSLAQQLLGHGLASRLSARLGEGVVNGLMTARIGIAAMDLCRPLPFRALKRPSIGDFISDLSPVSATPGEREKS